MAKSKLLTQSEYAAVLPKLMQTLIDALIKEQQDCALPESGTDLWDFPKVDSKTVVKLAPVIKELIGHRLRPKWIRKGGYSSIEGAVQDLLAHVQKDCVIGGGATTVPKPVAAIATP